MGIGEGMVKENRHRVEVFYMRMSLSSQLAQGLYIGDCHANASSMGEKFALAAFVSGRNWLENEGAMAHGRGIQSELLVVATLKKIMLLSTCV
ncbi:hypothetical protein [Candidatus Rhodobacter oscarellae]|uniref:hypothetical protein n=1 Tax=Candidatus Rhodobacter oscarellae TaxID=1675527 RepID=UPI001F469EDF|nr:hypothetical protein [Candidatus Rhodobacter lobularis]